MTEIDNEARFRRAQFRAWHRGTREADMMVGCFFDAYGAAWGDAEHAWFEQLLAEQDVDIMAWGMGREAAPEHLRGPLLDAFMKLDYLKLVNRDEGFAN